MSENTEISPARAESPLPTSDSKKRKSQQLTEIEVDISAPEPPSKKVRRALKKGKTPSKKPSRKDADDDGTKPDQEVDEEGDGDKKEKKARSEFSVWVGNLPFTVTAPELKQWLVDNAGGAILAENITRIKLPTSKEKGGSRKSDKPANRGFAYVDFDGQGTQVAALALSENTLGARSLLIKDSKSFEGRPKKEDANKDDEAKKKEEKEDPNANRKIFVGNLGYAITEDDLWWHFEKCGEMEWVKVATFEDTGKCKGYGWIKFKEAVGAAWAVKGFVKIKEAIETEEDFQVGQEGANDDDNDAEKKEEDKEKKEEKKFKTRKWWVNKLKGRTLKIELAEDDQSRYKRRFGKDAQKKQQGQGEVKEAAAPVGDYVAEATKSVMASEAAVAAA